MRFEIATMRSTHHMSKHMQQELFGFQMIKLHTFDMAPSPDVMLVDSGLDDQHFQSRN